MCLRVRARVCTLACMCRCRCVYIESNGLPSSNALLTTFHARLPRRQPGTIIIFKLGEDSPKRKQMSCFVRKDEYSVSTAEVSRIVIVPVLSRAPPMRFPYPFPSRDSNSYSGNSAATPIQQETPSLCANYNCNTIDDHKCTHVSHTINPTQFSSAQ